MKPSYKTSSIPESPHPAVLAFSKALEDHLSKSNSTRSNSADGIIQKSLLLGWRSRHSLSPKYPVTIQIPAKETKKTTSFSFTMMQVHDSESQQQNVEYGTGAFIWPASIVLLKYLEHRTCNIDHDFLRNKSVLDLGAGTGITSIAAALLGASIVVCTDGLESVVHLARKNVDQIQNQCIRNDNENFMKSEEVNEVGIKKPWNIKVCEYLWGEELQTRSILNQFSSFNSSNPDIILVSDCVLPKLYPIAPLVRALKDCMGSKTKAYLSYEYRFFEKYDPKEKFWELAADMGMKVREIPHEEHHEVYQAEDIEIWEVCLDSTV